jgi:TetR/AcrR family transcriptional repressor of nem operon
MSPVPGQHPPARGEVRTALLDATLALVRRQGWAATSIDQLCRTVGVTKGAFFHHFGSKEELGVAAARRWGEVTAPLFASAAYHRLADPLDRIFGYLDFRAALAEGTLEAIRAACGEVISDHAAQLARDFAAAIERYPPREPVTAASLATHTQTVLQGAFVLAKAGGDAAVVADALEHLKRYLSLLFARPVTQE